MIRKKSNNHDDNYQEGIVLLELLLVELLQVLLYFLQLQQLHLHGGVVGNPKKFSLMFLVGFFPLKIFN